MTKSEIMSRFYDDLDHMIWRSEIHRFSSEEVRLHYARLKNTYRTQLTNPSERACLDRLFSDAEEKIDTVAKQHRDYPDSGMRPLN